MKFKIYIDFDGVIQETWDIIFQNYKYQYHTDILDEDNLRKSMLDIGWNNILEKSIEINESYRKLHQLMKKYEVTIITKVNSVEEQEAKMLFLKERNILDIIFVPYDLSKTDFVDPYNSILIDDDISNLEEWNQKGGISILFSKYMKNIDSYGNKSDNFIIIDDLLKICDIIENR